MTIRDLIIKLGGQGAVADRLGLKRNSIAMWIARGAVPPEYHLALWAMALEAGLDWEPPGAAELRPLLAQSLCASTPQPPREAA